MARTTKTTTRKTTRRSKIEKNYPDTEGHKLSNDGKVTVKKDKAEIRSLKQAKQPKATEYTGPALTATKLYTRRMEEFKNTTADCLLLVDEAHGTYTFANTYKGGILPASYRPEKYTYQLNEKSQKKLTKKIEEQGFSEVDVTDWPTWIVSAAPAKRGRKSK